MLLLGIFICAGWAWLADSSVWTALDQPISFSRGHIRTAPFRIYATGEYAVSIGVSQGADIVSPPCVFNFRCADTASPIPIPWSLSKHGKVIAHGNGLSGFQYLIGETLIRDLDRLHAVPGQYILELDLLQDASHLNESAPRLFVFEDGSARWAIWHWVGWITTLSVISGLFLTIRSLAEWRGEKWSRFIRNISLTQPGLQPALIQTASQQHWRWTVVRASRVSIKLSLFGYIAAIVYALMAIIMMYLQSADHYTPRGLPAHLLRPGVSLVKDPWIDALLIHVQPVRQQALPRFDQPPDLYLGSRLVRWDDFDFALQQEIRRRPLNWPVYVQGERNLDWKWVARVIDKVRGSQAEVVLLTHTSTSSGKQSTSVATREISTKVR